MTNKNTGGPAFPRPKSPKGEYTDSDVPGAQTGMSLRDYFAAKALAGRCSLTGAFDETYEAEVCYKLADAMLAERSK